MNEGIINKIANFLYTKSNADRSGNRFDKITWGEFFALISSQVSDGQVPWDNKSELMNLFYNSTADCITRITDNISTVEMQLFREKQSNGNGKSVSKDQREWLDSYGYINRICKAAEVEEVVKHPALDVVQYINDKLTQGNAFTITTQHLELTGDSYWYLDYSTTNVPALIRFIPPHKIIDIEEDAKGTPLAYVYYKDGVKQNYSAINIIHFWYPGPWSEKFGCGNCYKSSGWANVQRNIITYINSNFKNMGIPAALLNFKGKLPDTVFQGFKKEFDALYTGVGKSGKVAYTQGEFELTKLGYTPDEMGIEITWRLAREAIANSFGVPISKLTDASNRAVAERHDVQFLRDIIQPKLMMLAQELTESLLPKFGNSAGLFFAAPNVVPEDETMALNKRKANLESGVTTRNEERAEMGIKPSDNPEADELYIPGNYVKLGTQSLARTIVDEVRARIKEKETFGDAQIK